MLVLVQQANAWIVAPGQQLDFQLSLRNGVGVVWRSLDLRGPRRTIRAGSLGRDPDMNGSTPLFSLIAASIFFAQPSAAGWMSGNELLSACEEMNEAIKYQQLGWCRGYIVGIADAMSPGNSVNGYKAKFTAGITVQQLTDVVLKFLREHPEDRHYSAGSLVAEALSKAFPSKR